MKNIVHFGKYYVPDAGGIESVTASLARGAAKFGHSVFVICFKKSPSNIKEVIDGVYITRTPVISSLASQPLSFRYFWECFSSARKADIVHLHAPNILGALCALFIPKQVRLLVHWHSDIISKGWLGKIVRPLESAFLRRANGIIATSQVYADASKRLAPFRDKVTVLPIGVPHTNHKGVAVGLPLALQEQIGEKKLILAVGRLVPYKGFDVLIQAAQKLSNDSVVVVVGEGPLRYELQRAVDLGGLKKRVLLVGRMSDDNLNALFEQATLFCLPSTYRAEAFGVVLLEAMAHGIPIVATNIPGSGVPWVNQHGISGLNVPVGDAQALADACNQILGSEELRSRFSRGARQRFLDEFTEDVAVNRVIDIYERLLGA